MRMLILCSSVFIFIFEHIKWPLRAIRTQIINFLVEKRRTGRRARAARQRVLMEVVNKILWIYTLWREWWSPSMLYTFNAAKFFEITALWFFSEEKSREYFKIFHASVTRFSLRGIERLVFVKNCRILVSGVYVCMCVCYIKKIVDIVMVGIREKIVLVKWRSVKYELWRRNIIKIL